MEAERAVRQSLGVAFVALSIIVGSCSGADESVSDTTPQTESSSPLSVTMTSTTTAPLSTTTTTPPPSYGGEVRLFNEPATLNPWPDENWRFDLSVFDAFTVGALSVNRRTLEFEPDVISAIPTAANGGLVENADGTFTVTYEIREEAEWADGRPISGDDFAFTYEIGVNPINDDRWRQYYEMIIPESIEVGPKTFSYTMREPSPGWQALFEFIVPKHDVEGSDFLADFESETWVSAGPFRFDSWDPDGSLVFARNDNYWRRDPVTGGSLPYLDRLVIGNFEQERLEAALPLLDPELHDAARLYTDEGWGAVKEKYGLDIVLEIEAALYQAEIARFLAGDIHSLSEWLAVVDAAEMVAEVERLTSTPGVFGGALVTGRWEHFAFHLGPERLETNPQSWNEHLAFRQAVAHALDRELIVDTLWGGVAQKVDSYTSIVSPSPSSPPWAQYEYDPVLARQLLDDLCRELQHDCDDDPPTLHYTARFWPDRVQLGELLTEMLGQVGIEVEVLDILGNHNIGTDPWDTTAFSWDMGAGVEALASFHGVFDPQQDNPDLIPNAYRWCTDDSVVKGPQCDRYTEIYDQLSATIDFEEALELAEEAEQLIADDLVGIPLFRRPAFRLWRGDLVAGTDMTYAGPLFGPPLWGCDRWYVPEADS